MNTALWITLTYVTKQSVAEKNRSYRNAECVGKIQFRAMLRWSVDQNVKHDSTRSASHVTRNLTILTLTLNLT